MSGVGTLIVELTYNPSRITGAHLSIPLVAISEHLTHRTRFERIPAGEYEGVLTTYFSTGKQLQHTLKFKIAADQDKLYQLNLSQLPQIVTLCPVGAGNHPIVPCEMLVAGVDTTFRTVKNADGLQYVLKPAQYTARVTLPDCRMVTVPLTIVDGVSSYVLPVEEEEQSNVPTRREPRYPMAVPVALQTNDGEWIPTRSVNLSTMGICCQLKGDHITDKEFFVRMFLPVSKLPMECHARVRWTFFDGSPVPLVGLETELTGTQKESLGKWLNAKLQRT